MYSYEVHEFGKSSQIQKGWRIIKYHKYGKSSLIFLNSKIKKIMDLEKFIGFESFPWIWKTFMCFEKSHKFEEKVWIWKKFTHFNKKKEKEKKKSWKTIKWERKTGQKLLEASQDCLA